MVISTRADLVIATAEKLRFADPDRGSHISNTVFGICFGNARLELLAIDKPPLVFRAETHWPEAVEIGTSVERVGWSLTTLKQGLFVRDRCVANAQSIVALMNRVTRQPIVLPPETAKALRYFALRNSDWLATAVATARAAQD
jgi:hypothetical protein